MQCPAYLNYVFFDQDFNFISGSSNYKQVGIAAEDAHELLEFNGLVMPEAGYLFIYVSNEGHTSTGGNVYFDDLRIAHKNGPIIQEDHYYPFGLSINALSSSAPLSKPNRFKYNGKEFQTDFDLGWYDYHARAYDPQIGRFNQIDPHADNYGSWTPYNYVANNPTLLIDPDGKDWAIGRTETDDGVHYSIIFNGAIKVSDGSFTPNDLSKLADQIVSQMSSSYKITAEDGEEENGKTLTSSISVNIRVLSEGQEAKDNEHIFDITGNDKFNSGAGERGLAYNGDKHMYLNKNYVFNMLQPDNKNPQDLRTLPHEPGHTAGLEHPDERRNRGQRVFYGDTRNQYLEPGDDDDNLMYQTGYHVQDLGGHKNNNGKGFKINGNQMRILYKNRTNQCGCSN